MPYRIPMESMVIISEVLPLEISGNGKPVGGILPLTTSAFKSVCSPNTTVIPLASMVPNKLSQRAAMRKPRYTITAATANSKITPIKPNSSPMMERIKSLSAKGKKRYFCLE